MRDRSDPRAHPDSPLDRAIREDTSVAGEAELQRHLATCDMCAAEMEVERTLRAMGVSRVGDEALNRRAVDAVLASLEGRTETERSGRRFSPFTGFAERVRRLWTSQTQRWLRPAGLVALGTAALVAVLSQVLPRPAHLPPGPLPAPSTEDGTEYIRLGDGSEIRLADRASTVKVTEGGSTRTTVYLSSGGAEFRVHHDSRRLFRVQAGWLEIDDIGTVFRVDYQAGGKVRVVVAQGRVSISEANTDSHVELGPGQERVFSREAQSQPLAEPAPEAPKPPVGGMGSAVNRNQRHAQMSEEPTRLLAIADTARRAGQPGAAVAPLRRMVAHYPSDPRAPAAAFALGWVLLADLGRPGEAAQAFEEVERLSPRRALAEDAAARAAEAWHKAGDARRALEAARRYQRSYPNGRYLPLISNLQGAPNP